MAAVDWRLWQLLDSAFPIGGFAHSGGLEAAHQMGLVPDADSLTSFIEKRWQDAAHGPLVFAREAWLGEQSAEMLDQRCDAFVTNEIANRASRRLGRGLIAVAQQSFSTERIDAIDRQVRAEDWSGHLPVMFGVVMRALEIGQQEALSAYLFVEARAVFSAAIRLSIVGPIDAQTRLTNLQQHVEPFVADSQSLTLDEVYSSSPMLDLAWGQHDRLYSKLFQS